MRQKIFLAAVIGGIVFANHTANAQDELAMSNRRGTTSIVVSSRPDFIDLPDQGFAVSIGGPHEIVSYENWYYLYQNGRWYNSPDYRGPWTHIKEKRLPERIRRHRIEDIRRYRDVEHRKYDDNNNRNNRTNRHNMDQRSNDNRR